LRQLLYPVGQPRLDPAPDGPSTHHRLEAWAGCDCAPAQSAAHQHIFKSWPLTYYWSAYQSEWATDVLFRDAHTLAALYPTLVRHPMLHFHSPDVMRFWAARASTAASGASLIHA
jgi:hypothetical protein